MSKLVIMLGVVVSLLAVAVLCRAQARTGGALRALSLSELRVTEGAFAGGPGSRLLVEVPKLRAVMARSANAGPLQVAELRFTYLGPTAQQAALASGAERRQIGLKLRAQDSCNLAYVMWRSEPVSALVVSIKRNPGMDAHGDCGNGGYRNIKARRSAPVPVMTEGAAHVLRAELSGEELLVQVDGATVWQGSLGPEVLSFDGPVGLRSDNGRFAVELLAGGGG